jgi:hypothetical protein
MTLDDIIGRLEAATGPDPDLDRAITLLIYPWLIHLPPSDSGGWIHAEYGKIRTLQLTGSIAEALLLLDDSLFYLFGKGRTRPDEPLYGCQIYRPLDMGDVIDRELVAEAEHENAAICICIAALKARAAISTKGAN